MALFKFNKKEKPKPSLKQFGSTYDSAASAIGSVFFSSAATITDSELRLISEDETVFSGLNFLVTSISSKIGGYTNPDSEIKEFVNSNLEQMATALKRRIEGLLTNAFIFGWGAAEKVWYLVDGKIVLGDLAVYQSDSMSIKLNNKTKNIEFIEQTSSNGQVDIPIDKMVLFRLGEGLYGQSYIRKCYKMWKLKKELFKIWGVGMEKFALPIVWAATDGDATEVNALLKNIYSKTSLTTDANTKLTLLQQTPGTDFSAQFKSAIEYANYLMYRSLNLPQLLLGSENAGAYALGKIHYKMFDDIARAYAGQVVDVIMDQLISQMIDYNFPNAESYGQFVVLDEPDFEERERVSRFLVKMAESGAINFKDYDDVAFARQLAGVPDISGGAANFDEWLKKAGDSENEDVRDTDADKESV